ncbi:hypothetical protein Tco_0718352 [Tanacetum coccineum]
MENGKKEEKEMGENGKKSGYFAVWRTVSSARPNTMPSEQCEGEKCEKDDFEVVEGKGLRGTFEMLSSKGLKDGVFDGAFGGVGDEEVVMEKAKRRSFGVIHGRMG